MKKGLLFTGLLGFLVVCLGLLVAAVPADNTADRTSWAKWQEIGVLTNCDGALLNASTNCGDIRVEGYNALTLEIYYDRDAGDGYEFYLETCREG